MSSMDKTKLKKLLTLESDPELAIFDEITELNEKISEVKNVLSDINLKEVKTYEEELEKLSQSLKDLKDSLDGKDMVVNIPLDNLAENIKSVEKAIKGIKEAPEVKFPKEYPLSEMQINELLFAIQSIPEFPIDDLKKMVDSLGKKIEEIKLEVPEQEKFDYEFLDDKFKGLVKAIKGISITVASGGGIGDRANTNLETIANSTQNHICTDNTTTTILGEDETFTGDWQDCLNYQEVNISIDTDQNSATDGLVIEWSADAVNVADTDVFSVYANAGTNYTPNPAFRYVRVKYTNGSVAQTRFSLMTILRRGVTGGSFHRITDTLKDDSDGRLNLSVLKLRTAANNYVSGSATNAGNFKVSVEEYEAEANPVRSNLEGGGAVTIGTTAVELTFTGKTYSVILTANQSNTGIIYIGKSNVTNLGANALTFLMPGESLTLDYNDATNALYAVSDTAAQSLFKGSLL